MTGDQLLLWATAMVVYGHQASHERGWQRGAWQVLTGLAFFVFVVGLISSVPR